MFPENPIRFALADSVAEGHHRSHVPQFCGIQYNHSGLLKLRIGETVYLLEGAWVFLTWPGTHFEYELAGAGVHFYRFICMEPDSLEPYIRSGLFPIGSPPVKILHPERFSESMDKAIALIQAASPEHRLRAVWQVEDLLLQLREQQPEPGTSRLAAELDALAERMERHPERKYDFNREGAKLSVTLRHFRRIFKEHFGLPPNQYLIRCRLNKAGHLLLHTGETAGEIARRVGFDSEYYFSALFKQNFHLPPGAYRREFRFSASADSGM